MIKSYKDMSILKFQEYRAAVELNADNEIAQWYNVLPLFTDKPKSYYQTLKFGELKKEVAKFSWLLSERMPDEWVKDFEVNGEWFIVMQHATDWNGEQFMGMSNLTKDPDDIIRNLHLILATLCVKNKGEIIDLTEFDRRAKLFQEHLCILTAYPVGFFFAGFLAKLSLTTQYSSHLKKVEKKAREILRRKEINGDGIT